MLTTKPQRRTSGFCGSARTRLQTCCAPCWDSTIWTARACSTYCCGHQSWRLRERVSARTRWPDSNPRPPSRPLGAEHLLDPVEGASHRLLPHPVESLPRWFVHLRLPGVVHGPIGAQFVCVSEEANGEAGGIRSAERGRLADHWAHHGPIENVRLKLHQEFVHDHAAIAAQSFEADVRIFFHRLDDLANLKGCCFKYGACQVASICVARQAGDDAAGVRLPVGG